jgi:hypothetical protein
MMTLIVRNSRSLSYCKNDFCQEEYGRSVRSYMDATVEALTGSSAAAFSCRLQEQGYGQIRIGGLRSACESSSDTEYDAFWPHF